MDTQKTFIIDFDSTFVQVEALDELAKIALQSNPEKENITAQIVKLTTKGMQGQISFDESLKQRLALFQPTREHIEELRKLLHGKITPSFLRNKQFFQENAENIYIISGGFKEYIFPVVKEFGITEEHVLANSFTFDETETVIGYDTNNPLSQKGGKVKAVESLKLSGKIYVIGDGYTDYEIKKAGKADKFYAFIENVKRDNVMEKADKVIHDIDELLYSHNLPRSVSFPKSKIRVLLLESIHPDGIALFEKEGYTVECHKKAMSEEELIKAIQDVSILGIRSKTEVTAKVLDAAKHLHAVGAFCIGTNQINLREAALHGVAAFNAPYSNTRSVVELILGEIIMLYRHAFDKSMELHKGNWDKSADGCREIRGKKLGIIGYGNIGSQLSVLAESLGMEVYFYDVIDKLALGNARRVETLEELLQISDVVTVHVDGRKSNTNLIGEKEFTFMKDGVIFLNASRGHIVDVKALEEAIKSGKVGGAAVDVFPTEPKANGPGFATELQGLPNVILTPHIGGSTEEAQRNIGIFVAEKMIQFINTGSTTLSVNFPNIQLPQWQNAHRFIHIHKNVPGILAKMNMIFAKHAINIEGQYLKTNEDIGYVITDVNATYSKEVIEELKGISETIKVRIVY